MAALDSLQEIRQYRVQLQKLMFGQEKLTLSNSAFLRS